MRTIPLSFFFLVISLFAQEDAPPAIYEDGTQISESQVTDQEVIDYFGDQCKRKVSDGCYMLGKFFSDEIEPRDYHKAFKYFEQGCILKNSSSCMRLAFAYSEGKGVRQDYFKSADIDRLNCKNGHRISCYNLGISYLQGLGVKQNISKAKELYGKACDMKYQEGCDAYAKLNHQGY